MSSSVNYDDLFEEFVRLTSSPVPDPIVEFPISPETSPPTLIQVTEITFEINESLDGSPLTVLTPPSPITSNDISPPVSQQETFTGFIFPQHPQISSTSSEDQTVGRMCDSSQVTSTPNNTVVSSAGSSSIVPTGGAKLVAVESNSVHSNTNNGFLSGLLPNAVLQQQQNQSHSLSPVVIHGHNLGNTGMESQHHQLQPAHNNMQHPMHSMQNNACAGIQHHPLMDNPNQHHHPLMSQHQQMNLSHHHHQITHGPGHPIPHPNTQQYVPFGMHLNANTIGNGSGYSNHPMNPFHPHPGHHQIPNQQPAHAMNMSLNPLQQTCFMPHATCMHFQQNPQQLSAPMNTHRMPPSAIGWMNGPSSALMSNASQNGTPTTNHNNNTIVAATSSTSFPTQSSGTKRVSTSKAQTPAVTDPTALPGGLEVLWRELPVDCQKLLVPQDIPDTAKFRGYFTVCELLTLKRCLETRRLGSVKSIPSPVHQGPLSNLLGGGVMKRDGCGRRNSKRGGGGKEKCRKNATTSEKSGFGKENGKRSSRDDDPRKQNEVETFCSEAMQEDNDDSSINGELMISLEEMKHEIHTSDTPAVTGVGVGGVVKEAMDALSSNTLPDQVNNASSGTSKDGDSTIPAGKDGDSNELSITEAANTGNVEATSTANDNEANEASSSNVIEEMDQQKQISSNEPTVMSLLPSMPDSAVHGHAVGDSIAPISLENRYTGPLPPYRTSTLVLKLLQIGQYHIRSFSSVNPNRLRVLFNTQRMIYECQLPVIQAPSPDHAHPQLIRKVLTIDMGFEQIAMIRFGTNSMWMRVDGPPILTLNTNSAQDEGVNEVLNPHDLYLLDQIEKGQLKLSPIHQLFFLNERLVQLLESQFRVHPRFRQFLMDGNHQ